MWRTIGTGLLLIVGVGLAIWRSVSVRMSDDDDLAEEDERARMKRNY